MVPNFRHYYHDFLQVKSRTITLGDFPDRFQIFYTEDKSFYRINNAIPYCEWHGMAIVFRKEKNSQVFVDMKDGDERLAWSALTVSVTFTHYMISLIVRQFFLRQD
jgi:hypothetical protein